MDIDKKSPEITPKPKLTNYSQYDILTQKDLQIIFGFGKNKTNQLLNSGVLPVVKIGRQYRTTKKLIDDWFEKHKGKEIFL